MPTENESARQILVIDDQEDNLALMDAILDARGFGVLLAQDGPTGLKMAREHSPDLILLDLAMPGMDGFQVLEQLRQSARTRRIPVVILTANAREAALVERGLELGATEYLTKPIQMDELVVRLRSVLRLSQAERELDRLRRDFASMLVHDMRAPLDGVRLTLGVLKRQEEEGSTRWIMLDHATTATEEVAALVDGLLQASALEEEGFVPNFQRVELGPLIKRCLTILRPMAVSRGLAMSAAVPPDLPAVRTDPDLVKRLIENLLANALKFTPEGAVQICARTVEDRLLVEVHDTGPGIPDVDKARIFDRYAQGGGESGGRQRGYGLGLAFCHRAMTALGGAIRVEDAPGGGSVFSFSLPLEKGGA
ncbi:MAG: hybrid sensor histidine kinase/response regulator [Candidatus Sericytochromatia bacterium]|nr:hybrid sensor histidine kinase/response regulator [Candidatus Sericytochromatia bacterium]